MVEDRWVYAAMHFTSIEILETEFNLSVFMTYLESAENQPNIRRIMSRRKSAGKKIRPAEIGRKSAKKLGQPAANVKKIRLRGLRLTATIKLQTNTVSKVSRHLACEFVKLLLLPR